MKSCVCRKTPPVPWDRRALWPHFSSALPLFRAWDTAWDRLSRTNQYNLAAYPTSASARLLTFLVAGRMLLARSGLLDVSPALLRVAQGD